MNEELPFDVDVVELQAWLRDLNMLLRKQLGKSYPTEELAQEAGARLIREYKRGKVIHHPRAWLFRVGRHLAMDVIRRSLPRPLGLDAQGVVVQNRERIELGDDRRGVVACVDSEASHDELVLDGEPVWIGELMALLPAAMRSLPDTQRRALELHYEGGCSCKEIALEESISLEAAKVRLWRGRRSLEGVLSKSWAAKKEERCDRVRSYLGAELCG